VIQELLTVTREQNEHYGGAEYEAGPGLSRRLAAIERAIVDVARVIDDLRSRDR
jgi:hypothetical protein